MRAVFPVRGDVARIDDAHISHFVRNVFGSQVAQAFGGTGTAVVEAVYKGAGHAGVVEGAVSVMVGWCFSLCKCIKL